MKRNAVLFIWLLIISLGANAQRVKPCGEFLFDFIADNREYFSGYAKHQTILGTRVDLHGGFEFDSVHSVYVGMSYFYEMGHNVDANIPVPDLYYQFHNSLLDIRIGSFPRKGLLHYPLLMLTDSLEYYRPNIQGGFAQLNGKLGHQNIWLDWTSKQTPTVRETFLTGFSGVLKAGPVFLENYFHYWHRAAMDNDSVRNIRDNNSFGAFLGVNLTKYLPLDTLSISTGIVTSSDKVRPNKPEESVGSMTKLVSRYKRIGLDVTYYYGEAPHVVFGDKMFTSKDYWRFDVVILPFKSKYITSYFKFGLHIANGDIDTSQQLFITAKINNKSR